MLKQPRSLLQLSVLAALIDEPMNVYQAYSAISLAVGPSSFAAYPSVYRAVSSLHRQGLIEPIHGRGFTKYQLAQKGRRYLVTERTWVKTLNTQLGGL